MALKHVRKPPRISQPSEYACDYLTNLTAYIHGAHDNWSRNINNEDDIYIGESVSPTLPLDVSTRVL